MIRAISIASFILLGVYFVVLFYLTANFGAGYDMPITNFLTDPATSIALLARDNFWYTMLHMLPYFLISEGLLIYAILKFRDENGRVASKSHDNSLLEIVWTVIPVISVILIAWPTFDILDTINTPPKSDLEIKVKGQRFSFVYTYLDNEIVVADETLVVPAGKNVTLSLTSVDVIHAWWVPAFGVKYDLMPGRTTQIWFNAVANKKIESPITLPVKNIKTGYNPNYEFYLGQCAELCGPNHADMMIQVQVLPQEEYDKWVAKKLKEKEALASL